MRGSPNKPFVEGRMPIFPKAFQVIAIIYTPWHILRCLNATYLETNSGIQHYVL